MGGYLDNTISLRQNGEFARSGSATEVADWVILLDLAPETHLLYLRMCRIAKHEDRRGVRLTLTPEEADLLAKGKGEAALRELLAVNAITKVASYQSGKIRFEIEIYPPETRALRGYYRHAGGLPVVSYE